MQPSVKLRLFQGCVFHVICEPRLAELDPGRYVKTRQAPVFASEVISTAGSRMQSPARTTYVFKPRFVWPTRFYPQYTSGLDYVSYVSPVERVAFQKVLPRYMLSTSQSRDTGLSVSLESIQYSSRPEEAGIEAERRKPRSERHPYPHQRQFREYLTKWHIDVLA